MPKADPSNAAARWLLLIYRVPADPPGRRTYVWRQLRQLGAVYLQQAAAAVRDLLERPPEADEVLFDVAGAFGGTLEDAEARHVRLEALAIGDQRVVGRPLGVPAHGSAATIAPTRPTGQIRALC